MENPSKNCLKNNLPTFPLSCFLLFTSLVCCYLQVNFSSTFAIDSLCKLTEMFHQLWETQNMICRHTALTTYL